MADGPEGQSSGIAVADKRGNPIEQSHLGFRMLHTGDLGAGPEYEHNLRDYRQAVRTEVSLSLDDQIRALPEDLHDEWRSINSRIQHERKETGASLFELIKAERLKLRDRMVAAAEKGDETEFKRVEDRVLVLNASLRTSQATLAEIARSAGAFDETRERILDAQRTDDYEQAQRKLDAINVGDQEAKATGQVRMYNKTSADFGGINQAYAEGARNWMLYGRIMAEVQIAGESGDNEKARNLEIEAENFYNNEIRFSTWGPERFYFKDQAYQWLKKPKEEVKPEVRRYPRPEYGGYGVGQSPGVVLQALKENGPFNPDQFALYLPEWYQNLSDSDQRIFRLMMNLNYRARLKDDRCQLSTDEFFITQLKVERRALVDLLSSPGKREKTKVRTRNTETGLEEIVETETSSDYGARVAMATMVKTFMVTADNFKKPPDENSPEVLGMDEKQKALYIKQKEAYAELKKRAEARFGGKNVDEKIYMEKYKKHCMDHFVLSRRGEEILDDVEKMDDFITDLKAGVEAYIKDYAKDFEAKFGFTTEQTAELSVFASLRFLYSMGVIDSADEQRALKSGIYNSDAVRTMMMPGVKAAQKWSGNNSWGGPLGAYEAFMYRHDENYRERFNRGEQNMIPLRMGYSYIDYAYFREDSEMRATKGYKSLAQAMIATATEEPVVGQKKFGTVQLCDFKDRDNPNEMGVNVNDVKFAEFAGGIVDFYNDIAQEGKHSWGGDPKGRQNIDGVINSRNKVRDSVIDEHSAYLYDPNFIRGCVIMAASPERGLVVGSNKMILDVKGPYDNTLRDVMDERLFTGLKEDPMVAINRMYSELNANNLDTWKGTISWALGWKEGFFGIRDKAIRKAQKNRYKVLREEGSYTERDIRAMEATLNAQIKHMRDKQYDANTIERIVSRQTQIIENARRTVGIQIPHEWEDISSIMGPRKDLPDIADVDVGDF